MAATRQGAMCTPCQTWRSFRYRYTVSGAGNTTSQSTAQDGLPTGSEPSASGVWVPGLGDPGGLVGNRGCRTSCNVGVTGRFSARLRMRKIIRSWCGPLQGSRRHGNKNTGREGDVRGSAPVNMASFAPTFVRRQPYRGPGRGFNDKRKALYVELILAFEFNEPQWS